MNEIDFTNNTHTPETLISTFASALNTPAQHSILYLSGVYRLYSHVAYQDYFYDRLQDERAGYELTIRIPREIRQVVEADQKCLFKGYLSKSVRKEGRIELVFNVVELVRQEAAKPPSDLERRLSIYRQKAKRGYKNVNNILKNKLQKGEKARVAIIYGYASIVDTDVVTALDVGEQSYELVHQRANLGTADELILLLGKLERNPYDVIAIVRGGGAGIDTFDDLNLAHVVANLAVPLVTAIGHADDKPVVQEIADKALATPTALGVYLRLIAEEVTKEKEQAIASETILQQDNQATEQLKLLNKQLQEEIEEERKQTLSTHQEFSERLTQLEQTNRQLQQELMTKATDRHQLIHRLIFAGCIILATIVGIGIGSYFL